MKNIIKTAYLSLSMLTVISHADMQLNNLHISAVPQSVTASATNAIPYITVNGTNYGQAAPLTFEGNAVTATGDVINISEIDPEFTRAQDEGYAYLYATNIGATHIRQNDRIGTIGESAEQLVIRGGVGAPAYTMNAGGTGSVVHIYGGTGGEANYSGIAGGPGGALYLSGGQGGTGLTTGVHAGGPGAALYLSGGAGGVSLSTNGGDGGNLYLSGGAGGAGIGATGTAGSVVFSSPATFCDTTNTIPMNGALRFLPPTQQSRAGVLDGWFETSLSKVILRARAEVFYVAGDIRATGTMHAAKYYGDGSELGNVATGNPVYVESDPVLTSLFESTPLIASYFTITQVTYTATALSELATSLVVTNEDRVETFFTSYVHRAYQLVPELLYATNNDFQINSTATNVLIDEDMLRVSFTDTNAASVTISHSNYSRTVSLAPTTLANYTNRYIFTGITGSLRYAMTDGFDAALVATNTDVYAYQNHVATNYVRNTNCWAYGLMDLSCVSPWNSLASGYRAGTAITPQHIAYAKHYPLSTGTVVRFVDAENTVYSRMVSDIRYPAGDIAVAQLDAALPESIVPAKILTAAGIVDYLPPTTTADARRTDTGAQIPCVFFNRTEHIYCGQWYTGGDELTQNESIYISYLHTNRSARYSVPVSGDSGNPVLCKVNTNTVLLTCWYTAQSGPSYKYHAASIASAIVDMGGTQTLSYITYDGNFDQVATNGPPAP